MKRNDGRLVPGFIALPIMLGFAAVTQAVCGQNLLVNGGFETGNFTGWSVSESGTLGSPKDYGVTNGMISGFHAAHSGQYGAYFNVDADLSQSIDIPHAGLYDIDVWVQPVFNDDDSLKIILGGTDVYSKDFTVAQLYTELSVTAFANAGPQTIEFQFTPGSGAMLFDDASLAAQAPDGGPDLWLTASVLLGLCVLGRLPRPLCERYARA